MIIDANSVILRAIEEKDLPYLQDMINDPDIERMTVGGCFPVSADRQKRWFDGYDQQKELRCMIEVKGGATVGMVILNEIDWRNRTASLGYKTKAAPGERKHGNVDDAVMGILNFAFNELGLECVYETVLDYNLPSQRLAERCGMKRDGVLRSRIYKNGERHDLISYSILKAEFLALCQNRQRRLL